MQTGNVIPTVTLTKPINSIGHAQNPFLEVPHCHPFRLGDSKPTLTPAVFLYWHDRLFLVGCMAYAVNRWIVKPHIHGGFFHSYFNDCWLIPCALPPVLWLHRWLRLRQHDAPPRISEIASHLFFWSLLFEWVGPKFLPNTTGDLFDALAYAGGAVLAALWWNRHDWFPPRQA